MSALLGIDSKEQGTAIEGRDGGCLAYGGIADGGEKLLDPGFSLKVDSV